MLLCFGVSNFLLVGHRHMQQWQSLVPFVLLRQGQAEEPLALGCPPAIPDLQELS